MLFITFLDTKGLENELSLSHKFCIFPNIGTQLPQAVLNTEVHTPETYTTSMNSWCRGSYLRKENLRRINRYCGLTDIVLIQRVPLHKGRGIWVGKTMEAEVFVVARD